MAVPTNPPATGLFSPKGELRAAIVAGVLLLAGAVLHLWLKVPYAEGLMWASLAIGMVYGGRPAIQALRAWRFDIDVLMVVGAGLAAYIGHPEEGALLLFLFVLAGALEELAAMRTKREIEALHAMLPREALAWRDGAWAEVAAETLAAGERIKVRPGERVPTDARVLVGESSMDQSAITGESQPRHVKVGDELFAGTINTDDALEATVLRPVRESSLQRILDLVIRAQTQREPVQRVIDRLSQPYALTVLGLSTVVALVWWLGLKRPLLGDGETRGALYTAITLLIVASPCALVIATPTATLAGIARAARAGVLFKGGQSIDALASIAAAVFDKTGTLTLGRPRLSEVHAVAWSDADELLGVSAALEADSTHPIAAAVREAAAARGVPPAGVRSINHTVAQGLEGVYQGRTVRLGRYAYVEPLVPVCLRARVREVLATIQERGNVGVVIAMGAPVLAKGGTAGCDESAGQAAVLIMADAARPGAETLVADLHTLGVRPVRMLTGDNRLTAERVAESLRLDAFDAELLPEDKLRIVTEMKQAHADRGGIAAIGDGVNDAPALAAASVSVAIGTIGTAAAMESADIVLVSDNLAGVPWAVRFARRVRRTVKANLALALSIIAAMSCLTVIGSLMGREVPLAVGVLAHEGGTVLVVLNSLRLLLHTGPASGGR
ncbi:MAG: hypothetical protein HBSAPP03_09270 [Phycisphaerae bacterium]|nr:MAG: hypothetical protein HBSAPP03_09270 [Phycisphaerae bacterium]